MLTRFRELGAYTDRYTTQVPWRVSHADFVEAFYTTRIFGIERWLLTRFGFRASTDIDARRLAAGEVEAYSAWTVEARAASQLLLCDHAGRTRSWLMVETNGDAGLGPTQLYFGSAVIPSCTQARARNPWAPSLPLCSAFTNSIRGCFCTRRARLAGKRHEG
ncbi:MAG: hypothetical protein ACREPE_11220 [Lysobacter sp.]